MTREYHWLYRLIGPWPNRGVETDVETLNETGSGTQVWTRAATEPTSEP